MKKVGFLLVFFLLFNMVWLGAGNMVFATNPPQAPTNLTATAVSSTGINLSWTDNANTETGFKIERGTSESGTFVEISAVAHDVTTFSDTGLTPNTAYWYRVRAYNSSVDSEYSNVATATTFPLPPSAPTGLTAAAASSSQINLSWTDTSGNETGFKIERKSGTGIFQQIVIAGANITAFSDTGLSPGVTYTYRLRAYNSGGDSDYTNEAFVTTGGIPSAPAGLAAVAVSGSQVNLAWSDTSNNETGFKIERRTGSGSFVEIISVGANTTAYSDTGLSSGVAYTYRIRAFNDAGNSLYSNEAAATTGLVPAAPSNLAAAAVSSTQVNLTWTDNSNNETGFKIERKTGSSSYTQITIVGANVTTYSDTGLSAGITYTYRVRAYNSVGDSPYSSEASVTAGVAPAAPSNLVATPVSTSQINLTWTDNSNNETGFKVERRTTGGSYTQIAVVGANTTTFANSGLSASTSYSYRVRAYNSWGDSSYSDEASSITSLPAAPTNLAATTLSNTQIQLTWTDNAGNETGFLIERKTAGGSYVQMDAVGANVTIYTNSGLSSNTTYTYRVRAHNPVGNSAYSNEANAVTTFIAAPSNLAATTLSNTQIQLTWTDNSNNEAGFKIERKTDGGSYTQIATVGANVTTYSNTGLVDNTTYFYRVRANNSSADSEYSNEVSATTGAVPAAPSNLIVAALSGTQISLSWRDNSNNGLGFKVERKIVGGSYTQIAVVGANTTAYSDTGLSSNTTYFYRVRAYNSIGNSAYSQEVSAATGVPAAPAALTATAVSKEKIMLTWIDNATNETGFSIERKTAGGSYTQVASVSANTTVYSDAGLSAGTVYHYRVRAHNAIGNSSYSNEAVSTTAAEPERITVNLNIGKTAYYLNGQRKQMDATPIISEGRTLLPIRYVAEAIGAALAWDSSQQKTTITFKSRVIELWIGKNTARVDGEPRLIDPQNLNVKPIIIPPGRTMLPLRFIGESLGCQVDWNPTLQEVKVTYSAP